MHADETSRASGLSHGKTMKSSYMYPVKIHQFIVGNLWWGRRKNSKTFCHLLPHLKAVQN